MQNKIQFSKEDLNVDLDRNLKADFNADFNMNLNWYGTNVFCNLRA